MNSNIDNATLFLVNTLFGLYIYAVILRVLLQYLRADFYNPLSQFIWKVTNPPVQPLRNIVPRVGNVDLAACLIGFLLILLNLFVALMILGAGVSVGALLGLGVLKLLVMIVNLYTFSILIQAIISWFGASMHSPASSLLWNINEPLLRPLRRVIPTIGGLDLSPLVIIIVLQVISRLIPLSYVLR